MALVHQLIAGNLDCKMFAAILQLVPPGECQIVDETALLLGGTCQHVEGDVQGLLVAELRSQPYVGLGLRPVALLSLQASRQGGFVDLADGRHIVVGDPLPQLQLTGQQYWLAVKHLQDGLDARVLGVGCRVLGMDNADIGLATPEGDEHTNPHPHLFLQLLRNGIGKQAVKRQGEDDVGVHVSEEISEANMPGVHL